MKKIILLILLCISQFSYCQKIKNQKSKIVKDKIEVTVLKDSDFIINDDRTKLNKFPFYMFNGEEKPVVVNFTFDVLTEYYNMIGIDNINNMLILGNEKTKNSMKNKYTYIPRKINLFFVEKDSIWLFALEYTAQNDYGAMKDGTSYTTFNPDGSLKTFIIP